MPRPLEDRRIVVTGGFGALGRAVAEAVIDAGGRVALLDRASPPANLNTQAFAVGGVDLASEAGARDAMARVTAQFSRIDGLVNVAGGFRWQTIEHGDVDTWDQLYAMNVRTALLASRAALPQLLAGGRGRIVNIGALAAAQAGSGMGAYAASKAGVARLTEAMAEEFKDRGLTVNAVLPSIIDTPANRADMPQADASRWVNPRALAEVIVFLLSDAGAPITGALIPVKGRV